MNERLDKDTLKSLYGRISPFELKDKLISLANLNKDKFKGTVLDAGRGNPNWIASSPRQAFFALGNFSLEECSRTFSLNALAGMANKKNIYSRFKDYCRLNLSTQGVSLLKDIIDYSIKEYNFNEDDFLFELVDGIIGDNYPYPDRNLIHIEKIVNNYLMKELGCSPTYNKNFDVFSVEGGTAAMCYIFDSLTYNNLLKKGDTIALMTPIFTPYLEIPLLPEYDFNVVHIHADEVDENNNLTYQYSRKELEKLKDKNIKALFVVNPNNPASMALTEECIENLVDVVKTYNEDLMIITDDVYCTFVNNFKSIISYLPYNTICVYSLSKYFGVTGWRLGTILLHKNNVFNKLISNSSNKIDTNERYKHLSLTPDNIQFIDRLVADSRKVALNHTAGLSTPQQVQMALFCGFTLIDKENSYKNSTINICRKRKALLFEGLESEIIENSMDASYYTEINIIDWSKRIYGEDFANYILDNYEPFDFLYDLAKDYSIILLNGDGFASSQWSFRISLANLNDNCYFIIGKAIKNLVLSLFNEYKDSKLTLKNEEVINL